MTNINLTHTVILSTLNKGRTPAYQGWGQPKETGCLLMSLTSVRQACYDFVFIVF